nr:hypothetical protein [Mycoplasmopsis bovis]
MIKLAKGILPAFDPLASSSNSVDETIIGKKHLDAIIEVKKILKAYKDLGRCYTDSRFWWIRMLKARLLLKRLYN